MWWNCTGEFPQQNEGYPVNSGTESADASTFFRIPSFVYEDTVMRRREADKVDPVVLVIAFQDRLK